MNDIQMNNVLFLCKIFFKLLFKYEARDMSKSKMQIVSLHILYITIMRRRKTLLISEEPGGTKGFITSGGAEWYCLWFPGPCSKCG